MVDGAYLNSAAAVFDPLKAVGVFNFTVFSGAPEQPGVSRAVEDVGRAVDVLLGWFVVAPVFALGDVVDDDDRHAKLSGKIVQPVNQQTELCI